MAIVVKNKENNKKYILLGIGFGAYKAVRPSFFGEIYYLMKKKVRLQL